LKVDIAIIASIQSKQEQGYYIKSYNEAMVKLCLKMVGLGLLLKLNITYQVDIIALMNLTLEFI